MKSTMKFTRKIIAVLCAALMITATAAAASVPTYAGIFTGDKPYLSLGADLTDSEKQTVYSLLGVDSGDLSDYGQETVTNAEEHEYLDDYIPSSQIGTRALSSVLIEKGDSGSGIQVETKNITYCTEGMYQNALATVGAKDIKVTVVGPTEISGTAALVGAIKAYSGMTGKHVSDSQIDGAVDELTTTGDLEQNTDADPEAVEGMIADLKEQVASGDVSTDEIPQAIEETASKYGVTLTDAQKQQLQSLLEKLSGLDLNLSALKSQASQLLDKLGDMGINVENGKNLWQRFVAWIQSVM